MADPQPDKPLVSYTVDTGTKPGEYLLVDVTMDRMINGYQGGRLSIKFKDEKTVPNDAEVRAVVIGKLLRETGLSYASADLKDLTPGAKVVIKDGPKREEPKQEEPNTSRTPTANVGMTQTTPTKEQPNRSQAPGANVGVSQTKSTKEEPRKSQR